MHSRPILTLAADKIVEAGRVKAPYNDSAEPKRQGTLHGKALRRELGMEEVHSWYGFALTGGSDTPSDPGRVQDQSLRWLRA